MLTKYAQDLKKMQFDDLLNLFLTQKIYFPVLRAPGSPKRKPRKELEIKIYSLATLPTLIDILRQLPDNDKWFSDEKYSIRYLIDTSGVMLFAREGKAGVQLESAGEIIPAHKEISSECIAAGNLFFNKDFTEIIAINNSSGDFLPDPNCLIWPVKNLKHSSLGFSDSFALHIFNNQGHGCTLINMELSPEQIKQIQELPIDMPQAPLHTTPNYPLSANEDSSDDENSQNIAKPVSFSIFSQPAAADPLGSKKQRLNSTSSSYSANDAMNTLSLKRSLKF